MNEEFDVILIVSLIQTIENELLTISNKKQKIFELFEEGMITRDEFVERKEHLNHQKKTLKKKIRITSYFKRITGRRDFV